MLQGTAACSQRNMRCRTDFIFQCFKRSIPAHIRRGMHPRARLASGGVWPANSPFTSACTLLQAQLGAHRCGGHHWAGRSGGADFPGRFPQGEHPPGGTCSNRLVEVCGGVGPAHALVAIRCSASRYSHLFGLIRAWFAYAGVGGLRGSRGVLHPPARLWSGQSRGGQELVARTAHFASGWYGRLWVATPESADSLEAAQVTDGVQTHGERDGGGQGKRQLSTLQVLKPNTLPCVSAGGRRASCTAWPYTSAARQPAWLPRIGHGGPVTLLSVEALVPFFVSFSIASRKLTRPAQFTGRCM